MERGGTRRVGTVAGGARGDGEGLAAAGSSYDGWRLEMFGSGSVEGSRGGVEGGSDVVESGDGVEGSGSSIEGGQGSGNRWWQAIIGGVGDGGEGRDGPWGTSAVSEGGGDGGEGVVRVVGNVGDEGWMAVAAAGIAHTGAYIYAARRAHGPRWCC